MGEPGPLKFEVVPVTTPANGPLAVELIPAPDPWDVARKLAHLPNLLFLDSSERHEQRGRYSYVTAEPTSYTSASIPAGEEGTAFRRLGEVEWELRDRNNWRRLASL